VLSDITGYANDLDLVSLMNWWSVNNTKTADIMLHAAALWALWKYRNDMCFNRVLWSGMQAIWSKTASTLSAWEVLCSGPARERVVTPVKKLEKLARDPPLLLWPDPG
jgi:hypothetical protein